MNRPVRPDRVTISLSPEAAAPLAELVASGKFATLDDAADAALQELQARQMAETFTDEALTELFGDLTEDDDRSGDVDAQTYLKKLGDHYRALAAKAGD